MATRLWRAGRISTHAHTAVTTVTTVATVTTVTVTTVTTVQPSSRSLPNCARPTVTTVTTVHVTTVTLLPLRQASRGVLRLGIDDPLDAFAVHGACGAWGLLAASLFSSNRYSEGGLFYGQALHERYMIVTRPLHALLIQPLLGRRPLLWTGVT